MSSVLTISMGGQPYGPVTATSANANQALPDSILVNSSRNVVRVVITCETNPIRYAFGGIIPTPGNLGHVLAANESLVINHPSGANSFRYVSSVAGNHGVLQITGEYAP